MMDGTNLNVLQTSRQMLRAFGGLNEGYGCSEAEFSGEMNFSSRGYPALQTRKMRRNVRTVQGVNGMYHLNGLLICRGKTLEYTPDDSETREGAVVLEHALTNDRKALTGMGTTLSVLWMSDNFVYIGHVGDSRVYLLRDGEFKQMTLDHSLVEQLVREGVLTEEEAQNHPMRNIITRAIGTDESVEVDVVVEERRKGDLWLACSDGLHGLVDDRQMRDALRQYAPEKAADVLLKAALDAGGRDNVTLVIVHDGEEPA